MICNPPVIGTIPADTSLGGLLEAFKNQLFTYDLRAAQRGLNPFTAPSPMYQCYMAAAKASALQMIVERNARRKSYGYGVLIPLTTWFNFSVPAQVTQWWMNSEDWWWNGDQGFCWSQGGNDNKTGPNPNFTNDTLGQFCQPGSIYEGDYSLSLRQMILDDLAAQNGQIMQPLHSLDGITPYPPDRLAQVQLAEAYKGLQAQEEAALQLLAQTQSAQTVAEISTKDTVTDPIGRLVTGVLTQQYTTGQPSQIAPSSSPQTPGGATVQTVVASQPTSPAAPTAAAPPAKNNILLLGALAAAGIFFFNRK